MNQQIKDLYLEGQPFFQEFFDQMMNLTWMAFVCLFFGFQHISDIAYAAVTKKNYSPRNFKSFLDGAIFFIFLIYICVIFARNLRNTIREGHGVVSWEEKAVVFAFNYSQNVLNETNFLTIGVVCLWLRVLNFSRYNEFLGRFLGVVKRLVSEIILFFVLYLINLFIFALVAESSFRDLGEYNSVWVAFRTLFYASFGTFDF